MKNVVKKSVGFAFSALISLSSTTSVHAAIIDYGSYFTDQSSGLDWYDVTFTVNRSYLDISSKFGAGGEFSGWRYATGNEFNNLLRTWTNIPPRTDGNRTITTGSDKPVSGLIDYFGSTLHLNVPNIAFTLGIIADTEPDKPNQHKVASIWNNSGQGNPIDFYNINHQYLGDATKQINIGSFLVRSATSSGSGSSGGNSNSNGTPVSEPHSLMMFVLGLTGLLWVRRLPISNK